MIAPPRAFFDFKGLNLFANLVSRELQRSLENFHFSISISKHFDFTFHFSKKNESISFSLCPFWKKVKAFFSHGGYLHHEWIDCENGCFEVFWREGSDWPMCKISTFTVTPFMFFVENYHIFYKYLTEIFFSKSLANFSPISNRFIRFYSNLSKIWAWTFCSLGNSQC